jgi:hypothetical protein
MVRAFKESPPWIPQKFNTNHSSIITTSSSEAMGFSDRAAPTILLHGLLECGIVKEIFYGLLLLALSLAAQKPGEYNDGEAHGDAPYLIEEGWKPLLNGHDLAGWHGMDSAKPNEWFTSKYVLWDRLLGPTRLGGKPAVSGTILNGPAGRTVNLVTDQKFGDMELYLEFMLAKGSNSGVYLHGLYEVQIFDSYGSTEKMTSSDGGGIYHRWIGNRGVGGSAPSRNASRRPGEWQSYQIWFRAPRFDTSGRKIENAKFLRVVFNGLGVQDNVEVDGGTRASMEIPEAATNPLMLQGDHGPVAFRNIYWRELRPIIER